MSTRIGGWLGLTLTRLAMGASPVDGSHGLGSQRNDRLPDTERTRSESRETAFHFAPRPHQTQFVRGLC